MNILIFGHVCIDDNEIENAKYESFGGTSMYMTFILNKFKDARTIAVSHHGDDFKKYTANVNLFPKEPYFSKTQRNFNRLVDGTPKTVKILNPDSSSQVNISHSLAKQINQAELIIVAPLVPSISVEYISELFKYTKVNTTKILLPQGYFRSIKNDGSVEKREFIEMDYLINLFDFIIMSDEDYPDYENQIFPKFEKSKSTLIITKGEKGAVYKNINAFKSIATNPLTPNDITDSVGSGDIFSASFGYNYAKTKSIEESIKFANIIAGKCLKFSAVDIYEGKFNLEI